jgi:hypothetical protein
MSVRTLFVVCCSAVLCVAFAPGAAAIADRTEGSRLALGGSCTSAKRTLAVLNRAASPRTFDDYIEDTTGPDICAQNLVANDNEGTITFGLHIHNRAGFAPNEAYGVLLDTDLDPATGGGGADFRVRFTGESTVLGKWDGTRFAPQSTLEPAVWTPGYGPTFRVSATDLGGIKGFSFSFFSTDGVTADWAPNRGTWSYQLVPLELAIRAFAVDRARAGRSFSARMAVVRSDLNAALDQGEITCSAKLGAKTLVGTGSFARGSVACTWRLPRSARGKRLVGRVAVAFQGVEAKRSFATKVR